MLKLRVRSMSMQCHCILYTILNKSNTMCNTKYHMMINKFTPIVDYNLLIKCLDTQVNEQINYNSIKHNIIVKPTNNQHYYKTLGTSVIKSYVPPLPEYSKHLFCSLGFVRFTTGTPFGQSKAYFTQNYMIW